MSRKKTLSDWNVEEPLFLPYQSGKSKKVELIQKFREAIDSYQLRPGSKLPSVSDLEDSLGVSKDCVLGIIRTLTAEGYVETRERSAIYVAFPPSPGAHRRYSMTGEAPYSVRSVDTPEGKMKLQVRHSTIRLDLDSPVPPSKLLSKQMLEFRHVPYHQYPGDVIKSMESLLDALLGTLPRRRGLILHPSQAVIIRGAYNALFEVLLLLDDRSDKCVFVAHSADRRIYNTVQQAGLRACAVDLESGPAGYAGLLVKAHAGAVLALILEPRCSYGTGVALSEANRNIILDLADECRFPVIEIDYDHEYAFAPFRPLFADDQKNVIYISCISKMDHTLFDMKLVCGPVNLVNSLRSLQHSLSLAEDLHLQAIKALISQPLTCDLALGEAKRLREVRSEVVRKLKQSLGPAVEIIVPKAGPCIFLHFPVSTDTALMKLRLGSLNIQIPQALSYQWQNRHVRILRLSLTCLSQSQASTVANHISSAFLEAVKRLPA
ncbi:GntR family transcriptional regulator [Arcticibacter sp. MXS-1]|uniref:GntR family transcriptional regulator n=1 Tax=Arcticibacter sp. MXS-1 TaxID=3341726 RepID=UPI0035A8BE78